VTRTLCVHDPADPELAPYLMVRDRDAHGPDGRPGLFIGESPVVIEAMLRERIVVRSILASERHADRAMAMIASSREARAGIPEPTVLLAGDSVLDAVVGFNIHRGFLAVGERPLARSVMDVVPPAGKDAALLVVEDCNNIDNIGQLFRNAAALGCSAVVLSPSCHDPLYRKSVRVSCGGVLRVPFARSVDWAADLAWLRGPAGVMLVGATGSGECTLAEAAAVVRAARPRRWAVVVGAEYAGLSQQAMEACHLRARIPMAAGMDSLNLGVAAGVFLARLQEG
jgi:tRNA G18 (ribose-2'-O)-methylase SpoU